MFSKRHDPKPPKLDGVDVTKEGSARLKMVLKRAGAITAKLDAKFGKNPEIQKLRAHYRSQISKEEVHEVIKAILTGDVSKLK